MTPTDTGSPLPPPAPRVPFSQSLPWVVLGLAGLYLLSVAGRMTPPKVPYDLDAFARLPVTDGGREKPLDTVARVNLRMISHREEFYDTRGVKHPAIRWYLDVLATGGERGGAAQKYEVFRIENDQVIAELGLTPREGLRYSYDEIATRLARNDKLERRLATAMAKRKASKPLDKFETKLLELAERVHQFENLANFKGPSDAARLLLLPPQSAGGEWASLGDLREGVLKEVFAKFNLSPENLQQLTKAQLDELKDEVGRESEEKLAARLAANPPAAAWDKLVKTYKAGRAAEQAANANEASRETAAAKAAEFNAQLAAYRDTFEAFVPESQVGRNRLEVTYSRFAPFYQGMMLYGLGFVLSVAGFVLTAAEAPRWGGAFRRSAFALLLATLVIHAAALLVRMVLMDRLGVFVTNLYSSAIFIGWGCVAIGLVLEWVFPIGVTNIVAAVLGVATSIVAHNLATEDTLEMMQAVLDTNFWLATHVTTVTFGYTATFFAGFLGAAYVFLMLCAVVRDGFASRQPPTVGPLLAFGTAAGGVVAIPLILAWFLTTALAKFELVHSSLPTVMFFLTAAAAAVYALTLLFLRATADVADAHGRPTPVAIPGAARPVAGMGLTPALAKTLGQMIYGVVCFATVLSFVGTVLGGIWADQSWGRFWGWDPKENGAVLIVLWNSLILHARWAGLVKDRGVAVLVIGGNMITAWSWFGTNQLGIGLHAYGFDTRLADGCANFWLSQMVIMALGLIPRAYWASALGRPAAGAAAVETVADGPAGSGKKNRNRR